MGQKTHGRLAAKDLASTTNETLYAPTSGRKATAKVSFCNRTGSDITVRMAMVDGNLAALANEDYMIYGAPIPANGFMSYDGVCLTAAHTLVTWASASGVSVVVHGVEEDA